MLCIREGKKRLAQQINVRADEQNCPSVLYRARCELKTCRLFVSSHLLKKGKILPNEFWGVLLYRNQQAARHDRLDSWWAPNSQLARCQCVMLISSTLCQSQEKDSTNSGFFWIFLWPSFFGASEQIRETLIASRLTYPFLPLDVQAWPRVTVRRAQICSWPAVSWLGTADPVTLGVLCSFGDRPLERCAVAPISSQLHGRLTPATRRLFALMTRNMPNSLFTSTSSACRNNWKSLGASSWGQ